MTKLLHALRHGRRRRCRCRDHHPDQRWRLGEGEDLIMVWRDHELLNMLSRTGKNVDSVSAPFDVSARSAARRAAAGLEGELGAVSQQRPRHDLDFGPPAIWRGRTP
jgi:hypothetical protein